MASQEGALHGTRSDDQVMKKRLIVGIVSSICLGLATNIAVVCGCAVWIDVGSCGAQFGLSSERAGQWYFEVHRCRGAMRIAMGVFDEAETPLYVLQRFGSASLEVREDLIPRWSALKGDTPDEDQAGIENIVIVEDARGWPALSMWSPVLTRGPRPHGGYQLKPNLSARDISLVSRAIPLRPIWMGFSIDTGVYTLLWILVLLGAFAGKRLLRSRRGRCVDCGYDLRGCQKPGCPECGWRREPAS